MGTTFTGRPNLYAGECRDCGSHLNPNEGLLVAISYYDWDNPDSDVAGSIMETRYEVRCTYRTECAERVVTRGTNLQALREVARDYENLGHLATEAQHVLAEYTELAYQQARTADLVAREAGYGVIGGPAHG